MFREQVGDQKSAPHPPVLILPHAGWVYSGLAAVRGLATLEASPPERIVLIGPSHRHYFMGFSPAAYEKYETPLGTMEVDLTLQSDIVDSTGFQFDEEAHQHEHSLEVILPMIQHVVPGNPKILPILTGSVGMAEINKLDDVLAASLDPLRDLLLISTDLSHFYSYEKARKLDRETLDLILEGDGGTLIDRSGEGGRLCCGFTGVVCAIGLAKRWGLERPEILIYYNSGDSGGERNNVVGYASIAYPPPRLDTGNSVD